MAITIQYGNVADLGALAQQSGDGRRDERARAWYALELQRQRQNNMNDMQRQELAMQKARQLAGAASSPSSVRTVQSPLVQSLQQSMSPTDPMTLSYGAPQVPGSGYVQSAGYNQTGQGTHFAIGQGGQVTGNVPVASQQGGFTGNFQPPTPPMDTAKLNYLQAIAPSLGLTPQQAAAFEQVVRDPNIDLSGLQRLVSQFSQNQPSSGGPATMNQVSATSRFNKQVEGIDRKIRQLSSEEARLSEGLTEEQKAMSEAELIQKLIEQESSWYKSATEASVRRSKQDLVNKHRAFKQKSEERARLEAEREALVGGDMIQDGGGQGSGDLDRLKTLLDKALQ
jgi:hypothetical protein